ncbi:transcriptional regulator [Streptomyces sp. SID3343]|uniref:transcriptional regulator n=1 Tax=Streptomyces sp. SID3343 TaxID=2690260 RepID=UPI001368083D|nr:transcriptional regulator [Streptomyces sp. SID3343]MYW01848.1 transcriptional regulator [Streptomyces sp. SID3343]
MDYAASPLVRDDTPQESQVSWLAVRGHLNAQRFALTDEVLSEADEQTRRLRLLTRPGWIANEPVPLETVRLLRDPAPRGRPGLDGTEAELDGVRPRRDDGTTILRYSEAVAELAPPRLFENRSCYRLLEVDTASGSPTLTFGSSSYFAGVIDVCEAAAHEFAAASISAPSRVGTPFRDALGDSTDLARRPVTTAISTLTIRLDRRTVDAQFLVHWRDPAKVASGGGLHQVMPVGVFQPSDDATWNKDNDFDLWKAITRELAEELLGRAEDYGSDKAPIDYPTWPFYADLTRARDDGRVGAFWLGLGMDPLTFVTDMLTAVVIDADLFDDMFAQGSPRNSEGHVVRVEDGTGAGLGTPFTEHHVERLLHRERMRPAGAAPLGLAWSHRKRLLGN